MDEVLQSNQVILGWANATGLKDKSLSHEDIKGKLRAGYKNIGNHALGNWSGSILRFMQGIKAGDYVLIPKPGKFYSTGERG